jgi:hypothetical protein
MRVGNFDSANVILCCCSPFFMSVGSYEKENQAEKGHTIASIDITGLTFAGTGFQSW